MTTATVSPVQLRDYQREALAAVHHHAVRGLRRQLIALPTGSGKTVIFSQLPRVFPGRMLVIAHREELLGQAAEKISWANPALRVDVEQAGRRASSHADVVVASIQTLATSPQRLQRLNPETLTTVVVDECHHSIARSYLQLLARFGLAPPVESLSAGDLARKVPSQRVRQLFQNFRPAPDAPLLVGVTATPNRTDGRGLEYVFDQVVYDKSIISMIQAGWLADVRGIRLDTGVNISEVKVSRGDYQEGELSRAVNVRERNDVAVKGYQAFAEGRQALVFCVDVAHTQAMCQAFQEAGIWAGYVVGGTPKDERADTIDAYHRGSLNVLTSCMTLTEGFDDPQTSAIIMARPTKSSLLYTQMLGRGTRIVPGKDDLLVLDLVDVASAGVNTVNTLFGLPPSLDLSQVSVMEAEEELADYLDSMPMDGLGEATTIEDVIRLAEEFNPLLAARLPDYLDHHMAWVSVGAGYALSLSRGNVGVVVDLLGQATVKVHQPGERVETCGAFADEQDAIAWAEEMVRQRFPDDMYLVDRSAPWRLRKDPPTEKQLLWCQKMGVHVPVGATKSDVQIMLSRAFAGRN